MCIIIYIYIYTYMFKNDLRVYRVSFVTHVDIIVWFQANL